MSGGVKHGYRVNTIPATNWLSSLDKAKAMLNLRSTMLWLFCALFKTI